MEKVSHEDEAQRKKLALAFSNLVIYPRSFAPKVVWLLCADYQQWPLEKFHPNVYVARDKYLRGKH